MTVTYYFNTYDEGGEEWNTNPGYMVDGDIETNAQDDSGEWQTQLLTGNTCDGTNLGTISKVELRIHCTTYLTQFEMQTGEIKLRPVFGGSSDGDNHNVGNVDDNWSDYIDITNDTNAPSTWTWSDIQNLDCDVDGIFYNIFLLASKVEIRVTYYSPSVIVTLSTLQTSSSFLAGNVFYDYSLTLNINNLVSQITSVTFKSDIKFLISLLNIISNTLDTDLLINTSSNLPINIQNIDSILESLSVKEGCGISLNNVSLLSNLLSPQVFSKVILQLLSEEIISNTLEPTGLCDYEDIGLRIYDGTQIVAIAVKDYDLTSKIFRIEKNGKTYGILLVDSTDPNASKIRVFDGNSIKALRKI